MFHVMKSLPPRIARFPRFNLTDCLLTNVFFALMRFIFIILKPVGKFEGPRVQSLGPDRLRSVNFFLQT
jgi:hypothetical protein